MSNNLPYFWDYRNTGFEHYGEPQEIRIPFIDNFFRDWRWPLPYKSTISVPICGLHEDESDSIIGFLCIDSPNRGAFRKDFDFELLKGLADGIAPVLNQLQQHQDAYMQKEADANS